MTPKTVNEESSLNIFFLASLVDNPDITLDDKLKRQMALYARWEHEDVNEVVEGSALVFQ